MQQKRAIVNKQSMKKKKRSKCQLFIQLECNAHPVSFHLVSLCFFSLSDFCIWTKWMRQMSRKKRKHTEKKENQKEKINEKKIVPHHKSFISSWTIAILLDRIHFSFDNFFFLFLFTCAKCKKEKNRREKKNK